MHHHAAYIGRNCESYYLPGKGRFQRSRSLKRSPRNEGPGHAATFFSFVLHHADAANEAANQFQSAQAGRTIVSRSRAAQTVDPTPRGKEGLATWSSLTFRQEFVQNSILSLLGARSCQIPLANTFMHSVSCS